MSRNGENHFEDEDGGEETNSLKTRFHCDCDDCSGGNTMGLSMILLGILFISFLTL